MKPGSDTETKTNFIIVKGTVTDPRDDQTYSIVTIGSQTWFAENLNYETPDSWWYDNSSANGDVSGRLYTWNAAVTACPGGWRLSHDDDWKTLEMLLGMSQSEADKTEQRGTDEGKKLKSTSGWSSSGNGTDEVGFSALPGTCAEFPVFSQVRPSSSEYLQWTTSRRMRSTAPHADHSRPFFGPDFSRMMFAVEQQWRTS